MQDRQRQLDEIRLQRAAGPYIGSFADMPHLSRHVRLSLDSGLRGLRAACPLRADCVEKVFSCDARGSLIQSPH
jgi:hypothetical protein